MYLSDLAAQDVAIYAIARGAECNCARRFVFDAFNMMFSDGPSCC